MLKVSKRIYNILFDVKVSRNIKYLDVKVRINMTRTGLTEVCVPGCVLGGPDRLRSVRVLANRVAV